MFFLGVIKESKFFSVRIRKDKYVLSGVIKESKLFSGVIRKDKYVLFGSNKKR